MKSFEVQKDSIRAAILMECVKNKSLDVVYQGSVLYQRLTSPETRNLVYQCCLEVVEDPQRRRDVGRLLLNYITSFPPSQTTLQSIANKCRPYAASRSTYSSIFQELKTVVDTYLHHKPLSYMLGRTLPLGKEGLSFRQSELSSNPDYIHKCNLQPPIPHNTEKGKRILSICGWSDEELAATAMEKNKVRGCSWPVKYHVVGCKDYVNQLPLECTEAVIDQQVRALNSFWEKYSANPSLLRATSFLIKLMCDAYVSKIPLQSNYSFFRSVSICYLPTLFEMMDSTYACVRNHVYDILLTLGIHFQLVDTQGIFPGCTEAFEEELIWLLLTILRKQAHHENSDEMLWTAAAKCALAIMPPSKLHLIDARALSHFLSLPSIIAYYPHLYTSFAEAFAKRVLLWNPFTDEETDEVFKLDETEFKKLGHKPVAKLLHLYREAMTLGARLAFFQILFTHAVMLLQGRGNLSRLHPKSLRRCYSELVKVGFHWHLHSLLFYQSHQVFRELPGHITYDMDIKEMWEYKTDVVAIVQCILQIVDEDARLPDVIANAFKNTVGSRVEDREALSAVISDCVSMVPAMLKEDTDGVLYNIGWRMGFYCMRLSRENLDYDKSTEIVESLSENFVFVGSKDRMESAKLRNVCPDLLTSLIFLGRKHANQAVEPFGILIERFLLDTEVTDTQSVMRLYYRVLGSISTQNGPLKASLHADISQMLFCEQLVTAQSIVDGLGVRVLWAIYRSLYQLQVLSVCRARRVLVSLIDELDPASCSSHQAHSWKTVMADPYPPVALIGAQRILQMYGRNAYDRFDEAMSIPQRSEKSDSVYVLAVKVAQLAESRKE